MLIRLRERVNEFSENFNKEKGNIKKEDIKQKRTSKK